MTNFYHSYLMASFQRDVVANEIYTHFKHPIVIKQFYHSDLYILGFHVSFK